MTSFEITLYEDLMSLTEGSEAFYFQDFVLEGKTYRIFNYRLASYTDFLEPSAMECRGVMFEVENNQAVRLASLPMSKFFNLNENPLTMNLDLSQILYVQVKADGSLMSTYTHNDQLRLKSKGSLFSEQALHAMEFLKQHDDLRDRLHELNDCGYTSNLEWCAPQHRIVLGYLQPQLKVLNARHRASGEYLPYYQLVQHFGQENVIEQFEVDNPEAFISSVKEMTDIEGFVVEMVSGLRFKVKCDWYLSLHHAKDSVNNPRRLFEAILDEAIDDLRSMFYTDELAMKQIDEMQVKVDHVYNHMVKVVEDFYNENKGLDRKSYAIKGQQDPSLVNGKISYFGLVMNKYVGKPVDYKDFLKGKWRELGLKDTSLDKVE